MFFDNFHTPSAAYQSLLGAVDAAERAAARAAEAQSNAERAYHASWRAVSDLGIFVAAAEAERYLRDAPSSLADPALQALRVEDHDAEAVAWWESLLHAAWARVVETGSAPEPASRSTSPSANYAEDYTLLFYLAVVRQCGAEARARIALARLPKRN